ncbi:DUF3108 domain-containing protein [Microbulbifer aggregans]|uniref:DUF3108 domain-containing protein n=1 Tax=Microbulbifer aggregans TaxID=1769779 RepID=UPI001CFDAAA3|nr:DUF3108 domain-containing protein [Microbulbifer aggregans]
MLRIAIAAFSAVLFFHPAAYSSPADTTTVDNTRSEAPSASTASAVLQPFTAVYQAEFSGFGVTAERKLTGTPESWRLDFSANSMFAKIEEYSRFAQQGGRLVPQHYDYKKSGLGKDRHTALSFESDQRRVINVYNKARSIDNAPADIQDKISYQLQLALDVAAGKKELVYDVADGKKIRHYEFRVTGNEKIKTPMGMIDTIKVQRIRAQDSERVTNIWFAPQWNYALIKLQQQEDNGKSYQITLTKLSIEGKPVSENN